MNPLAVDIWLYVLAAYILVSFSMYVMARFSPYEWIRTNSCHEFPPTDELEDEEEIFLENQFSLNNTFWFITGTLLRQGSGLNPKVIRWVSCWFGTVFFLFLLFACWEVVAADSLLAGAKHRYCGHAYICLDEVFIVPISPQQFSVCIT